MYVCMYVCMYIYIYIYISVTFQYDSLHLTSVKSSYTLREKDSEHLRPVEMKKFNGKYKVNREVKYLRQILIQIYTNLLT